MRQFITSRALIMTSRVRRALLVCGAAAAPFLAATFISAPVLAAPFGVGGPVVSVAGEEVQAAVHIEGAVVQGNLLVGRVADMSGLEHVYVDDREAYVLPDGRFVFGISRDADTVTLRLVRTHSEMVQLLAAEKRTYAIERVNGLPPKTVTPPPEWAARRKIETGRVGKARSFTTPDTDWLEGFIRPAEGRFSGFYGSQRILNGEPRTPHYGLDVAGPIGTPIVAPAGGIVRLAAPDFLLEGGIVIIDHGNSVTSTLFHMNSVEVHEGQEVKQGEQIGTIGEKGRASGPHVDWRLNWRDVRLDPGLQIGLKP